MKKLEKHGFGKTEPILALIIVAAIAFIGWYVWDTKQKTDESFRSATSQQKETDREESSSTYFDFDETKLTGGWTRLDPIGDAIGVVSPDGRSHATLTHVAASANNTADKRLAAIISELQKDGYTATQKQKTALPLTTKFGEKQIASTQLVVSKSGKPTTHEVYGFATTKSGYLILQLKSADERAISNAFINSKAFVFKSAITE